MNLTGLRYFIAIADCGSYAKAAQQLFVTQPALSKQIFAPEEELGEKLFIRKNKSIELTHAGEICLKEARQVVGHCNALRSKVHRLSGEISLAYTPGMTALPGILKNFYSKYSNVNINLHCVEPGKLSTLLDEGGTDFAMALDISFHGRSDVEFISLSSEQMCVIVPEDHRLASRDSISIQDLAEEKFVMGERSMGPEGVDYIVELCSQFGFRPNASCYAKDIQSILYMVSAGYGVSIAVSYAKNLNTPGVRFLHVPDMTIPVNLVLAYKSANTNPNVSNFVKVAKKYSLKKV